MRTKQYLAAIRAADKVLVLETLYFADEIRDPADLHIPSRTKVADRELRIANQLIDSLTVEWKPARYEDTYRERVLDLVRRKGKGQDIDDRGAARARGRGRRPGRGPPAQPRRAEVAIRGAEGDEAPGQADGRQTAKKAPARARRRRAS